MYRGYFYFPFSPYPSQVHLFKPVSTQPYFSPANPYLSSFSKLHFLKALCTYFSSFPHPFFPPETIPIWLPVPPEKSSLSPSLSPSPIGIISLKRFILLTTSPHPIASITALFCFSGHSSSISVPDLSSSTNL